MSSQKEFQARGARSQWEKEEVERLIAWMEKNPQELSGRQSAWHKDIKDAVFPTDEHIPVKRIKEKAANMKTSWKGAKELLEQTVIGLRPEEHTQSFNEFLERKCPYFWRLDQIWGTRPNATAIVTRDSTPSQFESLSRSQAPSAQPLHPISQAPPLNSQLPKLEDMPLSDDDDDDNLSWAPTPVSAAPGVRLTSKPTFSASAPGLRRESRDRGAPTKRALEEGDAFQEQIAKRVKAKRELQRERLEAQAAVEREKQASHERIERGKTESNERIAQIKLFLALETAKINAQIHEETLAKVARFQAQAAREQMAQMIDFMRIVTSRGSRGEK